MSQTLTCADVREMLRSGAMPPAEPEDLTIQAEPPAVAPVAAEEPEGEPLPADFPAHDKLCGAGHATINAVAYLRDAGALEGVPGIGQATARSIAAALAEMGR